MRRLHKKWGLIFLVVVLVGLSGCVQYDDKGNSTEVPAAPGKPTLTKGDAKITVKWEPVSGATSYEVWWNKEQQETGTAQKFADVTGTTCEMTGLTNGTIHYVWVKAKNDAGVSDFSQPSSETPTATAS